MPDANSLGLDFLGWTDDALATLAAARGWQPAALSRLEVGWNEREHRATFTVTDETASPVGHLRYLADPTRRNGAGSKMLADKGSERQLYPAPETIGDDEPPDGEVVLDEGEPDTVALWSAGFAAVGVPGVESWRDEWAVRFTGRRWRVYVVFDCDEQGRRAADRAAAALVRAGVDARIVDLDPARDDGYDATDFLRDRGPRGRDELRALFAVAPPYKPPPEPVDVTVAPVVIEPLRAFLARELPTSESLVGVTRDGTNLLPRFGWVLPWGSAGASKTTWLVDLLFHVCAGLAWQHYPVARPLRVVAVVNEGVPGGLQDKLAQKIERWEGDRDLVLDGLAVYASPWGAFTFREQRLVDHLRDFARDFNADYVAFDPLHTLGTTGAGSPAETEEFKGLLRAFGLWDWLGVITAHHSNKIGMISGDWSRHADTVLRLEKDSGAATKLTVEKARPADPAELGAPMLLRWIVETLGFARVEVEAAEQVDEAELLARLRVKLAQSDEPLTLRDLIGDVQGNRNRLSEIVKKAIERGVILNVSPHARRYALRLPRDAEVTQITQAAQTRMDTGDARYLALDNAEVTNPEVGGCYPLPRPPFRGGGEVTGNAPSGSTSEENDDEPF